MKIVIYDLEIVKGIPGREARVEGIEYCEGWDDHANMGISVLCAYEHWNGRYRVFGEDNKQEFLELIANCDVVAGFNSMRFDQKVLEATWGPDFAVAPERQYDILWELWRTLGLNPDKFVFKTHGGYSLDRIAELNLGSKKTGHGALAPIQWQQGKFSTVVDYCLEDVRLTRGLLNKIIETGFLTFNDSPVAHASMPLPKPQRGRIPA